MIVRWIAALVAFLIVILIGMVTIGNFGTGVDPENFFDTEGANSFALIGAIALVVAFVVYAVVEYVQTGGFGVDRLAVRHAHHRAHADRGRDQHHPRPDRRQRPEDADLPRLHRHHPGRRPGRTDRRRPDRLPLEHPVDVRRPAALPNGPPPPSPSSPWSSGCWPGLRPRGLAAAAPEPPDRRAGRRRGGRARNRGRPRPLRLHPLLRRDLRVLQPGQRGPALHRSSAGSSA